MASSGPCACGFRVLLLVHFSKPSGLKTFLRMFEFPALTVACTRGVPDLNNKWRLQHLSSHERS